MRTFALLVTCVLIANSAAGVERVHRARHPYRQTWKRESFGRDALAHVGVSAGINHLRNHPHEWGQGAAGFGKRVASGLGKHLVKTSVEYTVAGLRHESLNYEPSHKHGFRPRLQHALVSTVVTRNTRTHKRTPAAGRISGNVTSALVSRLWQPASLHTLGSGFSTAGIGFGVDAGMNVAREFWPRHHVRHVVH